MKCIAIARRLAKAMAVAMLATAAIGQTLPQDPPSAAPARAAVEGLTANAIPVGSAGAILSPGEAAAVRRIIAGARIIGFGEPGHALREPLDYRNRLIRHLVEHEGLTAVALESGLADTQPVGEFVGGGPGDAAMLVRESLSWKFGDFRANLDLVLWLRDYNLRNPRRMVRLYGIDASSKLLIKQGRSHELSAEAILNDVYNYLGTALPDRSRDARRGLAAYLGKFDSATLRMMEDADRTALQRAIDEACSLIEGNRRAAVSASSLDAYEWAFRKAHDLREMPPILADYTMELDFDKIIRLVGLRDRMMADNVEWVLAREGRRGRVLVFAANGHITASPMDATVFRDVPNVPPVMGIWLRQRLGGKYRAVLSTTAFGEDANNTRIGSIDRAFVSAGKGRSIANIRAAPSGNWWAQRQTISHGKGRIDLIVPRTAADGILFFDDVTLAPLLAQAAK